MAIVQATPRVEAEILIDGVTIQEYEDKDEEEVVETDTVLKYIEAKSGANFAIRYRLEGELQHDVHVEIILDGKRVESGLALRKDFRNGVYQETLQGARSQEDGKWGLSKFAFSDLKTTDSTGSSAQDGLMEELKSMGQITLKFHYITNLRVSTKTSSVRCQKAVIEEVPEKALKGRALSHQSTLRDPIPIATVVCYQSDHLDPKNRPFASIDFRYRSREALKSLLIIPRSPSPAPLQERDLDSLSAEEMRTILQRQRECEEAAPRVKQEGGIKRERSIERSNTVHGDNLDDEVSFVSAKRRRQHPVIVDEDGTETIDLT